MACPPDLPASTAAPSPWRRFRSSDVALHLDMAVIGDVCVGVSLGGYRMVVTGFIDDSSGSTAALLAGLEAADSAALLPRLAHAVKGAAASMGLRAIQLLTQQIEAGGAGYGAADCCRAAADLREHLATARALLQRMGFV
jgi:HPt (histidine-containing phosphotransfer) domain-containing protein